MFDIKEYFQNTSYDPSVIRERQEDALSLDIEELLRTRFDKRFLTDKYKHGSHSIDIVHPLIQYPGNRSLVLSPDRIRFLLSFYPDKGDFNLFNKIVLRPRYVEIGGIELVSLFLAEKGILVLYLHHPHGYPVNHTTVEDHSDFVALKMDKKLDSSIHTGPGDDESDLKIHPLWYIVRTLNKRYTERSQGSLKKIDKFFIKLDPINDQTYNELNNISFYFSRNGY